MNKYPSEGLSL